MTRSLIALRSAVASGAATLLLLAGQTVGGCTATQQRNTQTALEAAEAACVLARAAAHDERADVACAAFDIAKLAADRVLEAQRAAEAADAGAAGAPDAG